MNTILKLSVDEMYSASKRKDSEYDGVFFLAVKTTGIFCRPSCPARMPLKKNVEYFRTADEAMAAGFRACKKCRPLEIAGAMPDWLIDLVRHLDREPGRNWTDQDVRKFGVEPKRVRRWFQQNHGITFHAYLRSRRLSTALAQLTIGTDATQVAFDAGFESLSGFRDAFQKWFGQTPGAAKPDSKGNRVTLQVTRILSPLGPLLAAADRHHLCVLEFADRKNLESQFNRLAQILNCQFCPGENPIIRKTAKQLREYFDGDRRAFDLPVLIEGTEFQKAVWSELRQLSFGKTCSYESIANKIGRPNAQRAVGRANSDNRMSIILPCHRVIRSDGQLSGYGGGLRRKQWLLDHERRVSNASD